MPFELDHVFIVVSPGGPEAELIRDYGLSEGAPNRHPGQGTACRRFFFENAMLELGWVEDEQEARQPPGDRLYAAERAKWRKNGASPFGICFRPRGQDRPAPPFPSWEYRPRYLSPPDTIHVSARSDRIDEPLLFYTPFLRPQRDLSQPPDYRRLERALVNGAPIEAYLECPAPEGIEAAEPLLEIEFGPRAAFRDFRPELPLILRGTAQ